MRVRIREIPTKAGCTLRVVDDPWYEDEGLMLIGAMEQPGDGRQFSVFLDPDAIEALANALNSGMVGNL